MLIFAVVASCISILCLGMEASAFSQLSEFEIVFAIALFISLAWIWFITISERQQAAKRNDFERDISFRAVNTVMPAVFLIWIANIIVVIIYLLYRVFGATKPTETTREIHPQGFFLPLLLEIVAFGICAGFVFWSKKGNQDTLTACTVIEVKRNQRQDFLAITEDLLRLVSENGYDPNILNAVKQIKLKASALPLTIAPRTEKYYLEATQLIQHLLIAPSEISGAKLQEIQSAVSRIR